ncbi:ARM repeat superfamily protein [Zea mays]|uniref:ARM repeat superfamily protein n=1 Tax=Zea mays TaxID=4577 RepID=A0A1D6FDC0_MAIZE|nr:ARM repeat superfamily protein [Zea mays]
MPQRGGRHCRGAPVAGRNFPLYQGLVQVAHMLRRGALVKPKNPLCRWGRSRGRCRQHVRGSASFAHHCGRGPAIQSSATRSCLQKSSLGHRSHLLQMLKSPDHIYYFYSLPIITLYQGQCNVAWFEILHYSY